MRLPLEVWGSAGTDTAADLQRFCMQDATQDGNAAEMVVLRLLVGAPGSGKTMLLRELHGRCTAWSGSHRSHILPLLPPIADLGTTAESHPNSGTVNHGKTCSLFIEQCSPSSLWDESAGDLRTAVSRLMGRIRLRCSDSRGGDGALVAAPRVVLFLDDVDHMFPRGGGRSRVHGLGHELGSEVNPEMQATDAARILLRELLSLSIAVPVAVICTASAASDVQLHPLLTSFFRCEGVLPLPPLSPARRGLAIQAACRHYGLLDNLLPQRERAAPRATPAADGPPRVALLSAEDAMLLGSRQCHGFSLGDVMAVARDAALLLPPLLAAMLASGAPESVQPRSPAPRTVSLQRLLVRLVLGRVPQSVDTPGAQRKGGAAAASTLASPTPATGCAPGDPALPAHRDDGWSGIATGSVPGCVDARDWSPLPPRWGAGEAAGAASVQQQQQSVRAALRRALRSQASPSDRTADGAPGAGGGPPGDEGADEEGGAAEAEAGSASDVQRALYAEQREQVQRPPAVTWDAIGGARLAKAAIHDLVLWPLAHRDVVARMGAELPTGLLLYGPPGTGKTLLAKAVASTFGARFLSLSIPLILRSGMGDSERALVGAFQLARDCAPCVVFIDELQALFARREGGGGGDESARLAGMLTAALLQCMDALAGAGAGSGADGAAGGDAVSVLVLAATNVPEALDLSLLRPGRFDRAVHVGLPDAEERAQILSPLVRRLLGGEGGGRPPAALSFPEAVVAVESGSSVEAGDGARADRPHVDSERLIRQLAADTSGYSGADLANICRAAAARVVAAQVTTAAAPASAEADSAQFDGGTLAAPAGRCTEVAVTAHLWAALRASSPSCDTARAADLASWRPPAGASALFR